ERPRTIGAASEGRGAEGTMLVATILDAEKRASSSLVRCPCESVYRIDIQRPRYPLEVRSPHDALHGREYAQRARSVAPLVERGGASHDHRAQSRIRTRRATDPRAKIGFRARRDRAAVEERGIRLVGRLDHLRAACLEHRARGFAVV